MRILVVDDDPIAGAVTSAILEDGGYQVALVESGAEALTALATGDRAAAVVSDMNMPAMTGLELLQVLRAQGVTLPFLLLSGDGPPADGGGSEPDGWLRKDENLELDLPATVGLLLAGRRGGQ